MAEDGLAPGGADQEHAPEAALDSGLVLDPGLLGGAEEPFPWDRLAPREVTPEQWTRFEGYMAEIFQTFGMDLDTPGTRRTPQRFLRAVFDSTSGYEGDPNLLTAFPTESVESGSQLTQVIEGPIQVFSLCEHHGMPFFGQAYVGYVPDELIIGISKLTRLVRLFARRFTVQERLGGEIAEALTQMLEPHGVAVQLSATHLCTQMRGVREDQSRTWTSFWRGSYQDDPAMRAEFLQTVHHPRG